MKHKLSVAIITKNEETNIERCLRSVAWADEIVVVDSQSTDRTPEIAGQFKCRIIETEWLGFGKTKQFAVDSASNDWIYSIDADEEVSDELRERVQRLLDTDPPYYGYRVRRLSYYLGRLIRYSGWQNDRPIRLFNRKYARFTENIIHESIQMDSAHGSLEEPVYHYTYPDLSTHIAKMKPYAQTGARQLYERGGTGSIVKAVLHGLSKFVIMYFIKAGFLDGKEGFVLALNSSFGVYLKYLYLWEMSRKR
jgi:glycosyltransferase involved in cell wall biosynthesis